MASGEPVFFGFGVVANDAEGVRWWRKAAETGDADAKYKVGAAYAMGFGGFPKDCTEARQWLEKAAAGGGDDAGAKEMLRTNFDGKCRW